MNRMIEVERMVGGKKQIVTMINPEYKKPIKEMSMKDIYFKAINIIFGGIEWNEIHFTIDQFGLTSSAYFKVAGQKIRFSSHKISDNMKYQFYHDGFVMSKLEMLELIK